MSAKPSHPQQPVYLIAHGGKWLAHPRLPGAIAFGTLPEARSRVADEALELRVAPEEFAVAEYTFSRLIKDVLDE